MPGVYDRKMFRMQAGGMMPPEMPPEMAMGAPPMGAPPMGAPPMDPGMAPGMAMSAEDLPPEVLQMAETEMSNATNELAAERVGAAVNQEVDRSIQNLDMAGDYEDIMNAVWDGAADIEEYRAQLAQVVGPEDAARTPDSVLALVQPTLQLAQIDQGIGALMQEELAEVGGMSGGITELATKSAVADGMSAETGALVNAVGNMAQGPVPMGMGQEAMGMGQEAMGMDPMMLQAMMQGAGPMGQGIT